MRKQYLWILAAGVIVIIILFLYFNSQPQTIIEPQGTQETETTSEETTTTEQTEEETQTEGNRTGGGGLGGDEGGGGGGDESSNQTVKVNYTLSVDSFPEELEVLTNYSVNDIIFNVRENVPYSVQVEGGTTACVLLTSPVKGGTVITWEVDGQECAASICAGFMGCSIFMDGPHTAIVYYSTPG